MAEDPTTEEPGGDRIAKVLARAGIASRRDAEKMIAEGRVRVNGSALTTPAFKVPPGAVIQVDGKVIAGAEPTRMWRYYKPPGLVTTHRDEKDRPTVFQHLPPTLPRVISVGRLDLNSEGLLLLTNDGALSRRLELPETGWTRRYRVRFFGSVSQAELDRLKDGVTVEGQRYGPIEAMLERSTGQNAWAAVSLREGKNREIRKVFEHLGLRVSRLIRIAYGPFQLGDLREGEVAEISGKILKEQLGLAKNPRRTTGATPSALAVIPAEPREARREPGSRDHKSSRPTPRADKSADKGHRRLFSSARDASKDQTRESERAARRADRSAPLLPPRAGGDRSRSDQRGASAESARHAPPSGLRPSSPRKRGEQHDRRDGRSGGGKPHAGRPSPPPGSRPKGRR